MSDHTTAPVLVEDLQDCAVVGDKGFDSKKHRDDLRSRGCEPCIPARENTKQPEPYDEVLYRSRHCIENLFQRIKVFRRVSTRYEKTSRMFLAFLLLSIAAIYSRDELWTPM